MHCPAITVVLTLAALATAPLAAQRLKVAPRGQAVLLPVGDTRVVVHELLLTNNASDSIGLAALAVSTAGSVVARWEGEQLVALARRAGPARPDGSLPLAPGEPVVLYLWIEWPGHTVVPSELATTLHLSRPGAGAGARTVAGPAIRPDAGVIAIAAPVRGGRWFVSNGFGNDTDHRRFVTGETGLLIPQRFGADFLKLAGDGNNATAERPLRNEAFHAFGEPVYAVADGQVAVVQGGMPDNEAGATPPPLSRDESPGNHVMLRLADSVFALYAHLRAGSIPVEPGQAVRRGQLIGRIGNSGNTSAPHLHFHLTRGPRPNDSEGVLFVFEEFAVLVEDYRFLPAQLPIPSAGRTVRTSVPRTRWVIRFPE